MTTIKSYTDISQSRKLAEILPLESADMKWDLLSKDEYAKVNNIGHCLCRTCVYAWSLAALLEELNRNYWNVSLKCCGAEWDMTYDDGERYIRVSSDYAIDACYEMVLKLHERKLL